jgi:hypothetical protein
MGEGPQPADQTEPQVQAEPEGTAGVEKGIPEAGSPSQQQGEVDEAPAQVVTQKPPQEQVEPEAPVKVTGEGEQPSAQAVPLDQAEPEPEPEPRVTVLMGRQQLRRYHRVRQVLSWCQRGHKGVHSPQIRHHHRHRWSLSQPSLSPRQT